MSSGYYWWFEVLTLPFEMVLEGWFIWIIQILRCKGDAQPAITILHSNLLAYLTFIVL